MFLAMTIDSEHYTWLETHYCDTVHDGFKWFKEYVKETVADPVFEEEENRITAHYHSDRSPAEFDVCEVYEVDSKPITLVRWHAYHGVGFQVTTFDSLDEARDAMSAEADELVNSIEDAAYDFKDDKGITVDTGIEWEMWEIL